MNLAIESFETALDMMHPTYLADPYPALAALRNTAPIAKIKNIPVYGDAWILTRYDDVERVLKDPRFSVEPRYAANKMSTGRWWMPRSFRVVTDSMLNKDDPVHQRLRAMVSRGFTPRFIENLEAKIEQITDDLLDDCVRGEPVDLMEVFAVPLPVTVISHMLGVPEEDRFKFRQITNHATSTPKGILGSLQAAYSIHRMINFLDALAKRRRREPDGQLISALVALEQTNDHLSSDELLAMLFLLLFAGHETTVNLIGSGMLALLDNPEQRDLLVQNPSLAETAVEELLRYTNPVQFGASRIALEDIELGGATIKKSDTVVAMLSAANRDGTLFENAEHLDITRQTNRHMAFGVGIHFCLGAPLARMEGRIAFNKLLKRYPNIRLAAPRDQIRWRASPIFRGLESLPVYLE